MGVWENDAWRVENSPNLEAILEQVGEFRKEEDLSYISMPVSSGKILYDVLGKYGVKNSKELQEKFPEVLGKEVVKPNKKAIKKLYDKLKKKVKNKIVIPADIEAQKRGWSQNDCMFLWFRVLEEKAKTVYVADGWKYSNGGGEEFVRVMEMQFGFVNPTHGMEYFPKNADLEKEFKRMREIKVYNQKLQELKISDGITLLSHAIHDLKEKGFDVPTKQESLAKLWFICIYGYNNLKKWNAEVPYNYKIDWNDEVVKEELNDACKRFEDKMFKFAERYVD
ncbi:hypothetical protein HZA97_00455 [Candidatus Woesearchaeota archaeon]|nr:hypothetical protein [Candidatus Woesearchaeota archaeon]